MRFVFLKDRCCSLACAAGLESASQQLTLTFGAALLAELNCIPSAILISFSCVLRLLSILHHYEVLVALTSIISQRQ